MSTNLLRRVWLKFLLCCVIVYTAIYQNRAISIKSISLKKTAAIHKTAAVLQFFSFQFIHTKTSVLPKLFRGMALDLPYRRTPGNGQPAKQYSNSVTVRLPHPTSSTLEIIKYAELGLKAIFKFGYNYQRVGIMLTDLVPADYRQMGVFTKGPDERLIRLSAVVDKVNKRYGQDKLRMASQMYNPEWPMKPSYLSPRYTTKWEDILDVI